MPLAVGSTTVFIAAVFVVPAALAALVPVGRRWIVATGVVLAAVWSGAILADEEPDDLGPAALLLVGFLLTIWIGGTLAGRLIRRRFQVRR